MERTLRAFISYRRHDAFMQPEIDGEPNFGFVDKLTEALAKVGFANVFVDQAAVKAGDHYESRIHQAISDCDLFVAIIGGSWLEILREKTAAGERDILVREIRAALKHEKKIVPVLVDGAAMPRLTDLPEQIRPFHYQNGVPIESSDSVESIAAALTTPSREVAHKRKLGSRWARAYLNLCVLRILLLRDSAAHYRRVGIRLSAVGRHGEGVERLLHLANLLPSLCARGTLPPTDGAD